MQPQYEWDEDKVGINLRKHRISFQEGATIFNVETMKKTTSKARVLKDEDLRPEYDFTGAMRGRHYRPLDEGYTVQIKKPDGTTVVEHYTLAEGPVLLQPDVREYFPDSASVNAALRSLIALMAELPASRKRKPAAKKRSA